MNGMTWQELVDSIREADSYRNRVKPKRLKKDMGTYAVGSPKGSKKAQKGSPFKNVKVDFSGKGFNDISAPALEEEVEPESFDSHDNLEPQIWINEDEMSPLIHRKLVKIAQDFIDGLPVEVDIRDVTLTGSLANYNWSNYSDVDLHIIVDFLDVDENRALVKAFFDNARMRWNDRHDIKAKGYDVEIYVEDSREQHVSSGVYSLINRDWVRRPKKYRSSIDFPSARRKAEDIQFQVNIVNNLIIAGKYKSAMRNIERLKKKIRNMRRAGLESTQKEFSVENIAFKILRRNGILDELDEFKNQVYDVVMTVREEE
jgi:hypothetical protein